MDIVCANEDTRHFNILLANLSSMIYFCTSDNSPPYSVGVDHFNDENHLDLVVSERWGWRTIFLRIGNGSFLIWDKYSMNNNAAFLVSVAIDHLNNDIYLDIIVCDTTDNNIGILLGDGNGIFRETSRY